MRRSWNPLLPLLAILCGMLSVGLIVWAPRRETPTWTMPPPSAETPEVDEPPAPPEAPEQAPLPEPAEATPEPLPEPAPAEEAQPPSTPAIPEEELTGPLPKRSLEEEDAAAVAKRDTALLPAPGAITAAPSTPPSLAEQPHYWPSKIVLRTPATFPVYLNGAQAGTIVAPKGAVVALRKVLPDGQLAVEWQGSFTTVAASSTDLMARVTAAAAARAQAPPSAASPAPALPAPSPPPPQTAKPKLLFTVTRNRRTEGQSRQSWIFRVRVQNQTGETLNDLRGHLFIFAKAKGDALIVAANEELACDLGPNAEATLEPPPIALGLESSFDSYAVVMRDGTGAIVGSLSFREALTKDWSALEKIEPGSAVPLQK